jgi:hypothetical protein
VERTKADGEQNTCGGSNPALFLVSSLAKVGFCPAEFGAVAALGAPLSFFGTGGGKLMQKIHRLTDN